MEAAAAGAADALSPWLDREFNGAVVVDDGAAFTGAVVDGVIALAGALLADCCGGKFGATAAVGAMIGGNVGEAITFAGAGVTEVATGAVTPGSNTVVSRVGSPEDGRTSEFPLEGASVGTTGSSSDGITIVFALEGAGVVPTTGIG